MYQPGREASLLRLLSQKDIISVQVAEGLWREAVAGGKVSALKVLTIACETRPHWARERASVLVQFILKQYNTRPDFACAALQCLETIRGEGKRISEGDILDVAEVIIKDDTMKVDAWYILLLFVSCSMQMMNKLFLFAVCLFVV